MDASHTCIRVALEPDGFTQIGFGTLGIAEKTHSLCLPGTWYGTALYMRIFFASEVLKSDNHKPLHYTLVLCRAVRR